MRTSELLAARRIVGYLGLGEVEERLERMRDRGARVFSAGTSVRDRTIWGVEIAHPAARGGNGSAGTRATSIVVSGVHPIEWIGVASTLRLLDDLLEAPPTRNVIVVPIVNVDGYAEVEANLHAGRRRFVRHNARGVDLNRNFPSFWRQTGRVQRMLSRTFSPGTHAGSEPETMAVITLARAHQITRALSVHSFGKMVLFPYAWTLTKSPDHTRLRSVAEKMSERLRAEGGRPYTVRRPSWWIPGVTAGGLELDWFYDELGAESLLVECSRGGLAFGRLRDIADPFAWFNPARGDRIAERVARAAREFVDPGA